MSEQRFVELEIKVAYQEDLLQDLNQIVIAQQQQIDRLETSCERLFERIRSLQEREQAPEIDQTPPHY